MKRIKSFKLWFISLNGETMQSRQRNGVHFSSPETQEFMNRLYDARREHRITSIQVYGNHPDLGCNEASLHKDLEVAVVIPNVVFDSDPETKKLAFFLEGLRGENEDVSIWLENEGGYRNPTRLRSKSTKLLSEGQSPKNGYLGGWVGAPHLLLDYKKVTGRTYRDTDNLLEHLEIPIIPQEEASQIADVAVRDVMHGLVQDNFSRVAKGHLKAAFANAIHHVVDVPAVHVFREQYPARDRHNYHALIFRFLTDQNKIYRQLFDEEVLLWIEDSYRIRMGSEITNPRIHSPAEKYRLRVLRFVMEVHNETLTYRTRAKPLYVE